MIIMMIAIMKMNDDDPFNAVATEYLPIIRKVQAEKRSTAYYQEPSRIFLSKKVPGTSPFFFNPAPTQPPETMVTESR